MPKRTAQQHLDATLPAIERGEAFKALISNAADDAVRLADLMAEAIELECEARGLDTVGHDGRKVVCIESIIANHCAIAAKNAYLKARGSNSRSHGQVAG
jgi:hypothetical protein